MIRTLRERFLAHHRAHGFDLYESFPLVIDDPTILFTNATVTPFKPMFMGVRERKNFALIQTCLRLGGTGGDLETPRLNRNYTSMFDMLGSGLFDVSQEFAVAYFVEVLLALGLSQERLRFTTLTGLGFDHSLEKAGVSPSQVRLFHDAREMRHEWSFGEGDLHGCGVVAHYVLERGDNAPVQIGRIVHIDGIARGQGVEPFPYHAYDMGMGLNRVELALSGHCEESMQPWREISQQLQDSIPTLGDADAHYMANLYRVAEVLLCEGLRPGKKKQAYALRKVMRLLIEEIWLQSKSLADISSALAQPTATSSCKDAVLEAFAQEEAALRDTIASALRKQAKHPNMSAEELRATFGIRPSLLGL